MATIKLMTLTGKMPDGKEVSISTLYYIKISLENSDPAKGLTVKELLARTRVDRLLETVKEGDTELILEGENLTTVQGAVEATVWTGRNKIISELCEDLYTAKEVPEVYEDVEPENKLKAVKD